MKVCKVFDSRNCILSVTECMGKPSENQLQGTVLDQLVEVAGRICYDSLGKGRDSKDYHKHIIEVNHGSVWEHVNLTFEITPYENHDIISTFLNRPGCWIRTTFTTLHATLNLRTIREFNSWGLHGNLDIQNAIKNLTKEVAPLVMQDYEIKPTSYNERIKLVAPLVDEEIWISMYMRGSRGWSHEQVRHGDYTAISQRSTRYVDESESEYIWHPLILEYQEYVNKVSQGKARVGSVLHEIEIQTKSGYDGMVERLQNFCIEQKKLDKFTARKQARGAARGLLCNALATEMIFSANLAQWKRMIAQRMNPAADGEIHEIFKEVNAIINPRVINVSGETRMGFSQ